MRSVLIPIPDSFFPMWKVSIPFKVRVSCEIYEGKLGIMEIAMSPAALKNLSGHSSLVDHIESELKKEIESKPALMKAV